MQKTVLASFAHLPRTHHDRHVLTSTVDVFGVAHWLLGRVFKDSLMGHHVVHGAAA
ncbi:hypothetical protein ACIRQY_35480 [Streptomyces sp. NPDC101490]|uniref:hypothetical protein n=1 Tax=Streptomyces sp. NPDC101490 TaxID=3366143 RepID=UPI00380A7C2F